MRWAARSTWCGVATTGGCDVVTSAGVGIGETSGVTVAAAAAGCCQAASKSGRWPRKGVNRGRESEPRLPPFGQRARVHRLLRQVRDALNLARIIHGQHAWMLEAAQVCRAQLEAGAHGAVLSEGRR